MKLDDLTKDRQAELILLAEIAGHVNPANYVTTLLSEVTPGNIVIFKKVEPWPDGSKLTVLKYNNPDLFPDSVFLTRPDGSVECITAGEIPEKPKTVKEK